MPAGPEARSPGPRLGNAAGLGQGSERTPTLVPTLATSHRWQPGELLRPRKGVGNVSSRGRFTREVVSRTLRASGSLPSLGRGAVSGWPGRVGPQAWLRGDATQALSCVYPQSCLEFSLRIQEFIELIRQNKRLDAVRYVEVVSRVLAGGALPP